MKKLYIILTILSFTFSLQAQNLGVDQTAPTSKVDINGNLSVGSSYSGTMAAPANGAIIEGFLGIGTPAPASELHIDGASPIITANSSNMSSGLRISVTGLDDDNDALLRVQDDGSTRLFIGKNGNLGIGVTPNAKFEIGGNSRFAVITDSINYVKIGHFTSSSIATRIAGFGNVEINIDDNDNTTNHYFNIMDAGNEIMRVTDEQRLGFRTTTPDGDIHILQSASPFPDPTTGGITLEDLSNDKWQIWNSNNFLSFGFNGTRVGYINNSTGAYVATSDLRLKKDIEPMPATLDKVLKLRPVTYHYKQQESDGKKVQGFIAQEVEQLFPESVHTDEGGDMRGISYSDFGVIAIKAIQEQQEIINELSKTVKELQAEIEELKKK